MTALDVVLADIVNDLAASLDKTTGTWTPSWRTGSWLPTNFTTDVAYRGMNTLLLWSGAIKHGYSTQWWATYKQWQSIGGQVRKGEHATKCIKWVPLQPGDNPEHMDRGARLVPRVFAVFNLAQQDGVEAASPSVDRGHSLVAFEEAFDQIPITYGPGEPAYVPALDTVLMPNITAFTTPEQWAATLAHEAAHWTGHKSRLARPEFTKWGDDAYAGEELVAEISASLTCAHFGITDTTTRLDHLRYIKHWLARLQSDPKLLLPAATAAQRATDHLLSYSKVELCSEQTSTTTS